MQNSTRRFRAAPGRTLVLPAGLTEGPTNLRLKPGDAFDAETDRIEARGAFRGRQHFRRYINKALRLGDLVEEIVPAVEPAAPVAPAKKE